MTNCFKRTISFTAITIILFLFSISFAQESLNLLTTIPILRDSTRVSSITPIGDFNADGYVDLAVGVTSIGNSSAYEAVYLYYGGPSFDSIADLSFFPDFQSMYYCGQSYQRKTFFGEQVTALGDFNGDRYDDFAISASHQCSYTVQNGRIYIYFGGPNPDTIPHLEIDGRRDYDCMGSLLASGDFNGDDIGDLLAHAGDEYYGDRINIFLGSNSPDTGLDWVESFPPQDLGVNGMSAGFDINNDGYDDFAIVRSLDNRPFYLYLGADTLSHQPALLSANQYQFFNFDFSGDGIDDFLRYINGGYYLCLGGAPFDTMPDYRMGWLGAWIFVYHRAGFQNILMFDDTRVSDIHRFVGFNIGIPPDTIPAEYIYYDFMRYPSAPNIGDINADGSDELAFGSFWDDSIQQVKIYNITTTGIVDNGGSNLPQKISLSAYPNPFNSSTIISIDEIDKAPIDIYDITGRKIESLNVENGKALWKADGFPSGIYFARLKDNNKAQSIKLILLK